MTIGSFLFLNPRLVQQWPNQQDAVCYLAYNDEPEVFCRDIPPNRWTFLGTWFLSPERHFWEWVCFVCVGGLILKCIGPRLSGHSSLDSGSQRGASRDQLFQPKRWMQMSTLLFYPYVAWTKLHWSNSNYPMRWLLFIGMPVGTLWILSALFTIVLPCVSVSAPNRYYMLQLWLSFVPSLFPVFEALFAQVSYLLSHGGKDIWETVYNLMYISHVICLGLVPAYYVIVEGQLSMMPLRQKNANALRSMLSGPLEWLQWQMVGNAWACLYYIGIMAPLSLYAGLSVNEMVTPGHPNADPNFRIWNMLRWFSYGCLLRGVICLLEFLLSVLAKTTNALPARRREEKRKQ